MYVCISYLCKSCAGQFPFYQVQTSCTESLSLGSSRKKKLSVPLAREVVGLDGSWPSTAEFVVDQHLLRFRIVNKIEV